jgi:DNA-binding transcriptional LysR family regulator
VADAPIRRPHLDELETFLLAARSGSLARAAEQLRISTAAAGKRVTMLETLAGTRLLERGPRGAHLTAAGRRLVPEIEHLLHECDRVFERLHELRNGYDATRISGLRALLGRPAVSTERLLSETERFLATIFHAVADGIALLSADDGVILEVNDALTRLVGESREALLGRDGRAYGLPVSPTEPALRRLPAADGTDRCVEISVTHVSFGGQERLLALVRELQQRRKLASA